MRHRTHLQVETLEDRHCPSGMVVTGDTVFIRGDNNDNTVAIEDDGRGLMTVTLDGQTTPSPRSHALSSLPGAATTPSPTIFPAVQ